MMKLKFFSLALIIASSLAMIAPHNGGNSRGNEPIPVCNTEKGCVFRTIFGEEPSNLMGIYNTTENVKIAIDRGLRWIAKAQLPNGGWGAGSHGRQDIVNPHAVSADPATTAMVAMALLRTGTKLNSGIYAGKLKSALNYLLRVVESTPQNQVKITTLNNTQIQSKLGQNIDAIITVQFLSNILDYLDHDQKLKERVSNALNKCVDKVQGIQDQDGSFKGAGWAGVLQSALANNALESAQYKGAKVDKDVLKKSRDYQRGNYDASSGDVNTEKGAGVVLYSVTGSARASAKQARKVKDAVNKAKKEGKLNEIAEINNEVLQEIGFDEDEADEYLESYQVYESSKATAQRDDVLDGFGNNGGEEFLSYLQTGESLIINQDESWKNWYENMSGRLVTIQNDNGSWSGHHCITSPVFCTATTLLTLSINNDVDKLVALGDDK